MRERRITVTLTQAERNALKNLADRERRDIRGQAAVLIHDSLKQRGMLPAEFLNFALPKRAEIDLLAPLLSDLPVKDQLRSLRHLLHKLDKAAADSDQADDFQKLLFELRADITARLSAGSW